jgi:YidC/Oxa1 family membrane protein insertase
VNDRRLVIALLLIAAIAFVPTLLMKKPLPRPKPVTADSLAHLPPATGPGIVTRATATDSGANAGIAAAPAVAAEDTVIIRSPLYRYAISTLGGRIVSSRVLHYVSLADGTKGEILEMVAPDDAMLASTLVNGPDTVHVDQVHFTASTDSVSTMTAPATVTLHGTSGSYGITLRYTFVPDDYRIAVAAEITGMAPTGGTLLVGLGNGLRNTESDPRDNAIQGGIVTKLDKTSLTRFTQLKPREVRTMSGPFEWAAVKSKYFVAALFAYDSTSNGVTGRIGGVQAFAADTVKNPLRAHVAVSLAVPASGVVAWSMYLGPMEYDRLAHMGRDFDDVNPYGWSWLRWAIRPFAVWIRALFVWMHHALGLGYGWVIILFGVMVRVVMWPLSRISMRSMSRMQAIQPLTEALKERYKDDPAQVQRETMKLYKEHNVNPLGGCWPMLLPYPLLVAVFFVLANTIEVRGVHFLWMPDLARADPLYLIPIIMAASMFAMTKISQIGLPPNPQTKMMTWVMPGMMLFFFARFASGVNLYYTIQNLASIPQQWLVVKERMAKQGKPVVGKI